MSFEDHLAALDEAVSDRIGTPAKLRVAATGAVLDPIRVILERPIEVDTLQDSQVAKARPTIEVSVADVPSLRKADVVELNGRLWEVAAAPTRPDDGRWWVADVMDRGDA